MERSGNWAMRLVVFERKDRLALQLQPRMGGMALRVDRRRLYTSAGNLYDKPLS